MLRGGSLLDYTNLFSPNKYEKSDKTIKIFSITKWLQGKIYCIRCNITKNIYFL